MTTTTATVPAAPPTANPAEARRTRTPRPDVEPEPSSSLDRFLVGVFVAVPLLAVAGRGPAGLGLGPRLA